MPTLRCPTGGAGQSTPPGSSIGFGALDATPYLRWGVLSLRLKACFGALLHLIIIGSRRAKRSSRSPCDQFVSCFGFIAIKDLTLEDFFFEHLLDLIRFNPDTRCDPPKFAPDYIENGAVIKTPAIEYRLRAWRAAAYSSSRPLGHPSFARTPRLSRSWPARGFRSSRFSSRTSSWLIGLANSTLYTRHLTPVVRITQSQP